MKLGFAMPYLNPDLLTTHSYSKLSEKEKAAFLAHYLGFPLTFIYQTLSEYRKLSKFVTDYNLDSQSGDADRLYKLSYSYGYEAIKQFKIKLNEPLVNYEFIELNKKLVDLYTGHDIAGDLSLPDRPLDSGYAPDSYSLYIFDKLTGEIFYKFTVNSLQKKTERTHITNAEFHSHRFKLRTQFPQEYFRYHSNPEDTDSGV